MKELKANSYWIIGGIVLIIASLYVWNYILDTLGPSLCVNQVLETVNSPDGTKTAVVFVRDCGATTSWSTQASVISAKEVVSDKDTGNVLRIDSDHGKAWPLAIKGWPIIKAEWESANLLTLHYSKNSSILLQQKSIDNVGVQYSLITKEFVERENIEARP